MALPNRSPFWKKGPADAPVFSRVALALVSSLRARVGWEKLPFPETSASTPG